MTKQSWQSNNAKPPTYIASQVASTRVKFSTKTYIFDSTFDSKPRLVPGLPHRADF